MGNENPTKKAEICGDRVICTTLYCYCVSVCILNYDGVYTCLPCHLCDWLTGCIPSHIDSSHGDGVVTLPLQKSCDSVAGGTAGNRGSASGAVSL